MKSSWNKRNCEPSDPWAFDPERIALLVPRNCERPGVTNRFWRGVGFTLLVVAPFYLLGIYLWLK